MNKKDLKQARASGGVKKVFPAIAAQASGTMGVATTPAQRKKPSRRNMRWVSQPGNSAEVGLGVRPLRGVRRFKRRKRRYSDGGTRFLPTAKIILIRSQKKMGHGVKVGIEVFSSRALWIRER